MIVDCFKMTALEYVIGGCCSTLYIFQWVYCDWMELMRLGTKNKFDFIFLITQLY
jgi:hypothetical protein